MSSTQETETWSEPSWHPPTTKIHRRKLDWVLVEDVSILRRPRDWGEVVQIKWDKLPALGFKTLEANTTSFYWTGVCVTVTDLLLDHKNRMDFSFKKGQRKKQHTRGKAYVVERGGAKNVSPKDAMHLVAVLWIIVSFSFYYKFKVSL